MDQTKREEFWNTLTHFIGIVLSLIGLPLLIFANNNLSSFSLASILFFEFGLLFVYISSTLYHYVENVELKKKLRTLDHISIFYLIAGSYAPICLITLYNDSGIGVFVAVLAIMFIGTFFKLFYTGKHEKFSLFLYLAMGWLIIFKINTLIDLIEFNGLALIVTSGLLYTFGTLFYSSKTIKYSHAIWHLFVLGGSATHFFFVLFFVI
ncbi:MAG: hemolysin III family protein [Flavobacteriaceae bacterium]|jgi:hemolysin III|nr:hemolysin III family protein [Flavobacteriaceae bacterium]